MHSMSLIPAHNDNLHKRNSLTFAHTVKNIHVCNLVNKSLNCQPQSFNLTSLNKQAEVIL